jgi:1-acyl-sn-glycerol-3-phosphate acyltransferase
MIIFYHLLAFLRAVTFGVTALFFFVTTTPLYPIYRLKTNSMRKFLTLLLSLYTKWLLFFMGIRVHQVGLTKEIKNHLNNSSYLIVGNHMSYLDVLAIALHLPSSFVTSVEIKNTPFLGHICQLIGCVFVERRNKKNIGEEIKEITDTLQYNTCVTIFPEATSTNGDEIIRFKRPLFRSSIDSKRPVLPITINYEAINNKIVTEKNRDKVCWYGDMTFPDHIWGVFMSPTIDMSITFGAPLRPEEAEDHVELSLKTYEIVSQNFRPFKTRTEKTPLFNRA